MNEMILVKPDRSLVRVDLSSKPWHQLMNEYFGWSNSVTTQFMKAALGRDDIRLITHDVFDEKMGLNEVGTVLYDGGHYPIYGNVGFVKTVLDVSTGEMDMVGLDLEGEDIDIELALNDLLSDIKNQLGELER